MMDLDPFTVRAVQLLRAKNSVNQNDILPANIFQEDRIFIGTSVEINLRDK